jgi:tetratricopeptide (TPR) repeat protein
MAEQISEQDMFLEGRIKEIKTYLLAEEWGKVFELCIDTDNKVDGYYPELIACMFEAILNLDNKGLTDSFIGYLSDIKENFDKDTDLVDQAMYFTGMLYSDNGDFEKAEHEFRELLELRTKLKQKKDDILYMLATIQMDLDKPVEAEQNMELVMKELNNRNIVSPYCSYMGEIKTKLNKNKEAKYWFDRAIKSDKYETDWYKKCALMLERAGNFKAALKYWDKIIALPPEKKADTVCDTGREMIKGRMFRESVIMAKLHRQVCLNRIK